MSVRIYTLAKQLGLTAEEMIVLLKKRHIISSDVKSGASTVDNINASALRAEFAEQSAKSEYKSEASSKKAFALLDPLARIESPHLPQTKSNRSGRLLISSSWHGARKVRKTLHPDQPYFLEP